ncbi:hypothetical protein PIB30_052620 [Stylosanthes scabra]|uniref:Uncharacterized protein n=1 Tax=Stylosanthes scabra TaxID=79078 RepID=A0ABU6TI17_9FABA|nr:hypothetical protein [Stylosanthes scabra]
MFTSDRSTKREVMEVDTMDALLAQNKAISQQLTALNKKVEKLKVASLGTQGEIQAPCGLCGGPHENHNCSLIRKINHWSKLTTWEISKCNLIIILMPTPTIPDGGTTLTLVGEEIRIKEATISKIVHVILLSKDHHFHNQQIYHLHLNRNHLNQIPLKQPWKSSL